MNRLVHTILIVILTQCLVQAQLINWVTETGLTPPSTFIDGQVITNFAGTGLDVRINVDTVSGHPRIITGDSTLVIIGGVRTDLRFTLTFLNGTASIRLDNHQNLQRGERITLSNPDGQDITLQQTSNNGGDRMDVDGVEVPALNTDVVQDDMAVVREANNGAGTSWYATMDAITSFTWEYDAVNGVSATEGFLLTLSSVLLPIELVQFSADKTKDNSVELTWQTASEINNDFFTIEQADERLEWREIARIDGAGNSSSLLNYSLIDDKPLSGTSYYRLKQTDYDGKFEYSEILSVNLENSINSAIVIYPNPTQNVIKIIGDKAELSVIRMYDVFGREIIFSSMNVVKSETSQLEIDLSHLANGLYFVKTKNSSNAVYKQ